MHNESPGYEPTPAMRRAAEAVAAFRDRHGFCPAALDVALELGIERSWCHRLLTAAARRGLLEHDPRVPRSWRPARGMDAATVGQT
jgi:DNA-binding IclR family transcriptional regulator